jgi:hypothetical protein
MQAPKSYLPFKNCHIVAIDGISPEKLKISAKKIQKDREKISHTSILNFIAKSLGIKGGFSEYAKVYEEEILPFMDKHGLKQHVDLIKPRNVGFTCITLKISKQSLSERLFTSGLPLPQRVFTGYDFNYASSISDGFHYFNSNLRRSDESLFGLKRGLAFETILSNVEIARLHGDEVIPGDLGYSDRLLKDYVLGGYDFNLDAGFNLIGDDLVFPRNQKSVIQTYNDDMLGDEYENSLKANCLIMNLFRERIGEEGCGWVEIIPFNENLVFIKGGGGQFDIIFKNLKEKDFKHTFMGGNLKISDVPYFVSDYSFKRWSYFDYKGWHEKDNHESECHYYNTGGKAGDHPGCYEILVSYFNDIDLYKRESRKFKVCRDGFIELSSKEICISNLVSIKNFYEFLNERDDYSAYRNGDDVLAVNADPDNSMPVACTWFDALAYCKWYSDKFEIPVRLLSSNEYISLRGDTLGLSIKDSSCEDLIYIDPTDGKAFLKHPPYMNEDKFQALKVIFREDIGVLNFENGLSFLNSNDFSEWMSDKTCIRSASLKSFYGNDNIIRSSPPLGSSGKYKHQKIGFRICYDIS